MALCTEPSEDKRTQNRVEEVFVKTKHVYFADVCVKWTDEGPDKL